MIAQFNLIHVKFSWHQCDKNKNILLGLNNFLTTMIETYSCKFIGRSLPMTAQEIMFLKKYSKQLNVQDVIKKCIRINLSSSHA